MKIECSAPVSLLDSKLCEGSSLLFLLCLYTIDNKSLKNRYYAQNSNGLIQIGKDLVLSASSIKEESTFVLGQLDLVFNHLTSVSFVSNSISSGNNQFTHRDI